MNRITHGDSKRIPLNRALSGRASDAKVMTEIIQRLAPKQGMNALPKPEPLLVQARLELPNGKETFLLWNGRFFTATPSLAIRYPSLLSAMKEAAKISKLRSREYRVLETSVITADEFRKGVANA